MKMKIVFWSLLSSVFFVISGGFFSREHPSIAFYLMMVPLGLMFLAGLSLGVGIVCPLVAIPEKKAFEFVGIQRGDGGFRGDIILFKYCGFTMAAEDVPAGAEQMRQGEKFFISEGVIYGLIVKNS